MIQLQMVPGDSAPLPHPPLASPRELRGKLTLHTSAELLLWISLRTALLIKLPVQPHSGGWLEGEEIPILFANSRKDKSALSRNSWIRWPKEISIIC